MKTLSIALLTILVLLLNVNSTSAAGGSFDVISPDKKLKLTVNTGNQITYSVQYLQAVLVNPSPISLIINSDTLGHNGHIIKSATKAVNETIQPLYGKFKSISNNYNELTIDFSGKYSLLFRVYNEGVAYRFVTNFSTAGIVKNEEATVVLNGEYDMLLPETPKLTSWELPYKAYNNLAEVKDSTRSILPALFTQKNTGLRVIMAEADLRDYPGMFIERNASGFAGYWARYPKKTTPYGGEWGMSTSADEREDFIAKTAGTRSFPWRVVMVSDDDKKLLTNTLIYQLSAPQAIQDVAWIKPGKADWEWWHDAIVNDAPFPTGMKNRSTQLYKLYIDFAADNHLDYTLIDAGWSNFHHLDTSSKKTDIVALAKYAQQKNVGLFVWCNATSLMNNLEHYLTTFQNWGLKGVKIDFFDRDDQIIINQMEEIAATAAKHHLMVDFHGCPKPTGMQRTYPNILNYEAVRGQECNKWDTTSNPHYHLENAFVRMLGGPLDYTPGSMRNRSKAAFKPVPEGLPLTQGTRCHELSLFLLFDAYLTVWCDSPEEYRKYKDITSFLAALPVTFDDTKALDAKLGEYAILAKRKGKDWYVSATTDWNKRDVTIDFSFLPKGKYTAEVFKDGADADTNAESYLHETLPLTSNATLSLHLASGGGAVMKISPVQ